MNIAEFIVNELLESSYDVVSVCAGCQKEFGTTPPPNASHGYCKRHTLEMYADAMKMAKEMVGKNPNAAGRVSQLMASIRDIRERPDSAFCPDMAQQQRQSAAPA
jgi:hypothetical protein